MVILGKQKLHSDTCTLPRKGEGRLVESILRTIRKLENLAL